MTNDTNIDQVVTALYEPTPPPKVYYGWLVVEPGLYTKNQLKNLQRRVLKPGAEPVAFCKTSLTRYPLYTLDQAVPMAHKRGPKDWPSIFAERFPSGPECEAAHGFAAIGLYELNRFTKHSICTIRHRERIYTAKIRFLRLLWDRGYCKMAVLAYSPQHDLPCWDCGGAGGDDDFNGYCSRCDGTGIYKTVGGKPYWSLRYKIGAHSFSWHLPKELAPWASEVGVSTSVDRTPVLSEVKPVQLARKKHPEALALLQWVCDAVAADVPF